MITANLNEIAFESEVTARFAEEVAEDVYRMTVKKHTVAGVTAYYVEGSPRQLDRLRDTLIDTDEAY